MASSLRRVLRPNLFTGIRIGIVTWAATSGALIGSGLLHGDAAGPFARFGGAILATVGSATLPLAVAVATGVFAHALWMAAWGVAFFALARSLRVLPAVAVASLLALVALLVSGTMLPTALGAVRSAALAPIQLVLVIVVMAASLTMAHSVTADRR